MKLKTIFSTTAILTAIIFSYQLKNAQAGAIIGGGYKECKYDHFETATMTQSALLGWDYVGKDEDCPMPDWHLPDITSVSGIGTNVVTIEGNTTGQRHCVVTGTETIVEEGEIQ